MKVTTELKHFQNQTVEWMKQQEAKYDGGMLLNEPGLGKTACCIKLIESVTLVRNNCLIICPSGLMQNWMDEFLKHTTLKSDQLFVYSGSKRHGKAKSNECNIVISNYNILARELSTKQFVFNKESIFNKKFDRIILDEAHYIRNKQTMVFRSVNILKQVNQKSKKWIVTATPIFNSFNDLYSYFNFLDLEGVDDYRTWKQLVNNCSSINQLKFVNELLRKHSITLKKQDVLDIPEKNIKEMVIVTDSIEREFYEALVGYSVERLKKMVRMVKDLQGSQNFKKIMCNHIMVYILRLKQACDSPWLVISKMERLTDATTLQRATEMLNFYNQSKESELTECPICFDRQSNTIIVPCGHTFCKDCVNRLNKVNVHRCPMCRTCIEGTELIQSSKKRQIKGSISIKELRLSSKIKNIIGIIKHKISNGEKVVVVSQWVSMLDIIREYTEPYFEKRVTNYKSISLQGNVSLHTRSQLIKEFESHDNYSVAYISLMSSAEGFTLVSANNIILVDLWWNDSKMIQVMDRLHRIGQTRKVNVYKLLVKDSIEEKIFELVTKKQKVTNLITSKWRIDTKDYDDSWLKNVTKLIEDNPN